MKQEVGLKNKKTLLAGILSLIILAAVITTGCQNTRPDPTVAPGDPFNTKWSLGEEGRTLSISGNTTGHAIGGKSEFLLKLNNQTGQGLWQDEYCIFLVDRDGILKEIEHKQFNVPVGLENQIPVVVQFPEGFEGPLGLCVIVPQRGSSVTTIWVGEKDTVSAGPWPTIRNCPYYLTEEGSLRLAEENEIQISPAPIHEVEVRFMESFPVQVGVYIQLGIRDGCTTFHDAVVTREGDTMNIEVTTQRPKEAICDLAYRFFEKNLNLGSDFTPGSTYTLKVNDYTTTFEMPGS